jgi:anti-sigma regulatory factor (Ser/Thr protein kinase)
MAFNEMITNAVVHGSGDVHANLTRLSDGMRLEVHDQGEAGPVVHRHPGRDYLAGRGSRNH